MSCSDCKKFKFEITESTQLLEQGQTHSDQAIAKLVEKIPFDHFKADDFKEAQTNGRNAALELIKTKPQSIDLITDLFFASYNKSQAAAEQAINTFLNDKKLLSLNDVKSIYKKSISNKTFPEDSKETMALYKAVELRAIISGATSVIDAMPAYGSGVAIRLLDDGIRTGLSPKGKKQLTKESRKEIKNKIRILITESSDTLNEQDPGWGDYVDPEEFKRGSLTSDVIVPVAKFMAGIPPMLWKYMSVKEHCWHPDDEATRMEEFAKSKWGTITTKCRPLSDEDPKVQAVVKAWQAAEGKAFLRWMAQYQMPTQVPGVQTLGHPLFGGWPAVPSGFTMKPGLKNEKDIKFDDGDYAPAGTLTGNAIFSYWLQGKKPVGIITQNKGKDPSAERKVRIQWSPRSPFPRTIEAATFPTVGHFILDMVGIVDPWGLADGANLLWYAQEGDPYGMMFSAIGIVVPYLGDTPKFAKYFASGAARKMMQSDLIVGTVLKNKNLIIPKLEALKVRRMKTAMKTTDTEQAKAIAAGVEADKFLRALRDDTGGALKKWIGGRRAQDIVTYGSRRKATKAQLARWARAKNLAAFSAANITLQGGVYLALIGLIDQYPEETQKALMTGFSWIIKNLTNLVAENGYNKWRNGVLESDYYMNSCCKHTPASKNHPCREIQCAQKDNIARFIVDVDKEAQKLRKEFKKAPFLPAKDGKRAKCPANSIESKANQCINSEGKITAFLGDPPVSQGVHENKLNEVTVSPKLKAGVAHIRSGWQTFKRWRGRIVRGRFEWAYGSRAKLNELDRVARSAAGPETGVVPKMGAGGAALKPGRMIDYHSVEDVLNQTRKALDAELNKHLRFTTKQLREIDIREYNATHPNTAGGRGLSDVARANLRKTYAAERQEVLRYAAKSIEENFARRARALKTIEGFSENAAADLKNIASKAGTLKGRRVAGNLKKINEHVDNIVKPIQDFNPSTHVFEYNHPSISVGRVRWTLEDGHSVKIPDVTDTSGWKTTPLQVPKKDARGNLLDASGNKIDLKADPDAKPVMIDDPGGKRVPVRDEIPGWRDGKRDYNTRKEAYEGYRKDFGKSVIKYDPVSGAPIYKHGKLHPDKTMEALRGPKRLKVIEDPPPISAVGRRWREAEAVFGGQPTWLGKTMYKRLPTVPAVHISILEAAIKTIGVSLVCGSAGSLEVWSQLGRWLLPKLGLDGLSPASPLGILGSALFMRWSVVGFKGQLSFRGALGLWVFYEICHTAYFTGVGISSTAAVSDDLTELWEKTNLKGFLDQAAKGSQGDQLAINNRTKYIDERYKLLIAEIDYQRGRYTHKVQDYKCKKGERHGDACGPSGEAGERGKCPGGSCEGREVETVTDIGGFKAKRRKLYKKFLNSLVCDESKREKIQTPGGVVELVCKDKRLVTKKTMDEALKTFGTEFTKLEHVFTKTEVKTDEFEAYRKGGFGRWAALIMSPARVVSDYVKKWGLFDDDRSTVRAILSDTVSFSTLLDFIFSVRRVGVAARPHEQLKAELPQKIPTGLAIARRPIQDFLEEFDKITKFTKELTNNIKNCDRESTNAIVNELENLHSGQLHENFRLLIIKWLRQSKIPDVLPGSNLFVALKHLAAACLMERYFKYLSRLGGSGLALFSGAASTESLLDLIRKLRFAEAKNIVILKAAEEYQVKYIKGLRARPAIGDKPARAAAEESLNLEYVTGVCELYKKIEEIIGKCKIVPPIPCEGENAGSENCPCDEGGDCLDGLGCVKVGGVGKCTPETEQVGPSKLSFDKAAGWSRKAVKEGRIVNIRLKK